MEASKVKEIFDLLSKINLSEFSKAGRDAILKMYPKFAVENEKIEKSIKSVTERVFNTEELKKKHDDFSSLRTEFFTLKTTEERKQEINEKIEKDYFDIVELEKSLNPAIEDLLKEDVKMSLTPIPRADFIDGLVANKFHFTAASIEHLSPILAKLK